MNYQVAVTALAAVVYISITVLQLVHCIELLSTPLPHTPHGYLTAFCIDF